MKSLKYLTILFLAFFLWSCEAHQEIVTPEMASNTEEEDDEEVAVFNNTTATSLNISCSENNKSKYCENIQSIEAATREYAIVYTTNRPRPKVCPTAVGSTCVPKGDYFLTVLAENPGFVHAEIYCDNELCGSTSEEHGGTIFYNEATKMARLYFGSPTNELVQEGATLVIRTSVNIEGELIQTVLEGEL